jgi:heterotetrameric sarcosine oxidase gamma subunit
VAAHTSAAGARLAVIHDWELADEFEGHTTELGRMNDAVGVCDLSHLPKIKVFGASADLFYPLLCTGTPRLGWVPHPGVCWQTRPDNSLPPSSTIPLLNAWVANGELLSIQLSTATPWWRQETNKCVSDGVYVLDATGHYAVLELIGPYGCAVLSQLTSLDVSSTALPPGTCAQTGVARIPAMLARVESAGPARFQVWCSREYGEYLWHTILEAARPVGGGPVGWRTFQSAVATF